MNSFARIQGLFQSAKNMGMSDLVHEFQVSLGGLVNVDKCLPIGYQDMNMGEVEAEMQEEIAVRLQIRKAFPSLY